MDSIVAALLGALIATASGLGGVLLAGHLAEGRDRRQTESRHAEERQARIRDRQLQDLGEARAVLVGQLSWLERRVVLGEVRAASPDIDHLTRYNINLVGDAAVVRSYGEVLRDLIAELPMTVTETLTGMMQGVFPKTLAELDIPMAQRISKVRAELLAAFDAQEERVLRDEPLARMSEAELVSMAEADALVDLLRERQVAHRGASGR